MFSQSHAPCKPRLMDFFCRITNRRPFRCVYFHKIKIIPLSEATQNVTVVPRFGLVDHTFFSPTRDRNRRWRCSNRRDKHRTWATQLKIEIDAEHQYHTIDLIHHRKSTARYVKRISHWFNACVIRLKPIVAQT